MLPTATELRIPRAEHARAEAIWTLTDAFCLSSLNDEYAGLCRRLVGRLARKRPSPLRRGRSASWAAGVIYAVGRQNFVFDRSQRPHVRADEIAGALGTAKSTMSAKASHIGSLLGLGPLEPDVCRAELLEHHPLAWLVSVDGIIVDARMLPPQLQRQAHRQGLIPFIPTPSG
jgi:Domain of unknown function (DUF6398)